MCRRSAPTGGTWHSNLPQSNLVQGDTNHATDVFVRDLVSGTTRRVSVSTSGQQGNADSSVFGSPSISADGRYVAFESAAANLVAGDTNGALDVFVHDLSAGRTTRVSVATNGAQAGTGTARCQAHPY